MITKAIVSMLVICWTPQPDGSLKEAWRIEEQAPLGRCLQMQSIFAGGGSASAITVRCGDFKEVDALVMPKYEPACGAFMQGFAAFFGRRC